MTVDRRMIQRGRLRAHRSSRRYGFSFHATDSGKFWCLGPNQTERGFLSADARDRAVAGLTQGGAYNVRLFEHDAAEEAP